MRICTPEVVITSKILLIAEVIIESILVGIPLFVINSVIQAMLIIEVVSSVEKYHTEKSSSFKLRI